MKTILTRCLISLVALTACLGALLWPTEMMLNLVGGVLIVLQIAALAIVLNPLARGRVPSAAFLLVSGPLVYWRYWVPETKQYYYPQSERWWANPISECAKLIVDWLTNFDRSNYTIPPSGMLAYLCDVEAFHFASVFVLQFALVCSLAAAWVVAYYLRRFQRAQDSALHRPRFQLGLRTLMIYTLLISLALGWAVRERKICDKFKAAFDRIEKEEDRFSVSYGGHASYFPWFNHLVWCDTPAETWTVWLDKSATAADFAALSHFRNLEEVSIQGQDEADTASNDALVLQLRDVPGLRRVTFEDGFSHGRFTGAAIDHLQGLPLESIEWHWAGEFKDRDFAKLTKYHKLKSLSIWSSEMTDEALINLRAWPQLERLELSGFPITNRSAPWIGGLHHLKELKIGEYDSTLDDDGLAHFSELTSLEHLELPRTVSDRGIESLRAIKKLRTFECEAPLSDKSCEWLGNNENLHWLQLFDAPITDRGVAQLGRLTKLSHLDIRGANLSDESLDVLSNCQNLTSLSVCGDHISDAGFQKLIRLGKLQRLYIPASGLTNRCLEIAGQFPSLSDFHLSKCKVEVGAMQDFEFKMKRQGRLLRTSLREFP